MKYVLIGLMLTGSMFLQSMRPFEELMEHFRDPRERYIKIVLHRTDRQVSRKELSTIASLVMKMACPDLLLYPKRRNDIFMAPDTRFHSVLLGEWHEMGSIDDIKSFIPLSARAYPGQRQAGIAPFSRDLPYVHVGGSVNVLIGKRGGAESNCRR